MNDQNRTPAYSRVAHLFTMAVFVFALSIPVAVQAQLCPYNSTQTTCACPTYGPGVTCIEPQLYAQGSCYSDPRSCATNQVHDCNTGSCTCNASTYPCSGCTGPQTTVGGVCDHRSTDAGDCAKDSIYTGQCGVWGCPSGTTLCNTPVPGRCVPNRVCPVGLTWDACSDTCTTPYVLLEPNASVSPQVGNPKIQGDLLLTNGDLNVAFGDVYIANGKAIRVDGAGVTQLTLGNWGVGSTGTRLNVLGSASATQTISAAGFSTLDGAAPANAVETGTLCLDTDCISDWADLLPAGTQGRTIYHNGTDWVASNNLVNTGSRIGIGTGAPSYELDVKGDVHVSGQLIVDGGGLITGSGSTNYVPKFTGAEIIGNSQIFDNGTNIGIGTTSPTQKLHVEGGALGIGTNNVRLVETGGALYAMSNYGQLTLTPLNSGWMHMYTDRNNFIFNKSLYTMGGKVASYSSDLTLSAGGARSDLVVDFATGTTIANGGLRLPSGASNGYQLTSDATGNASWQPQPGEVGNVIFRRYADSLGASRLFYYSYANRALGINGTFVEGVHEPEFALDIQRHETTKDNPPMIRLADAYRISNANTGLRLDRDSGGSGLTQRWFVGMDNKTSLAPTIDDFLIMRNGTTVDFLIDRDNGNIGIGTDSPYDKLDVNGTVRMTGLRLGTGAAAGRVLTSDASGFASWQSLTGLPPIGTAGGDLIGTYPSPTIRDDAVALGTDTTGNYVSGLSSGTGITVGGSAGEGWSPTVSVNQSALALDNFGGSLTLGSKTAGDYVAGLKAGTGISITDSGGEGSVPTISATVTSPWSVSGTNVYRSSGRVGIGTSAPQASLDVNGTAYVNGFQLQDGTQGDGYTLKSDASGNARWVAPPISDGVLPNIYPNYLMKYDMGIGDTESVIYDDGTNVGIGTESPSYKLDVVGNFMASTDITAGDDLTVTDDFWMQDSAFNSFYLGDSTTNGGRLYVYGYAYKSMGGSSWAALSDRRVKRNIESFDGGLELLAELEPKSFVYNGLGGTVSGTPGIGFVAQDIQDIAPWMVDTIQVKFYPDDSHETEVFVVNPDSLQYINRNAILDLQHQTGEEMNQLRQENQELRNRIRRLERAFGMSE